MIEGLYFGPVELNFNEYQLNDVLIHVNKNGLNLKVFDVQKLVIKDDVSNKIVLLFSRLDSLKINFDYCQLIDIIQSFHVFICLCNQLKHLDVIR